MLENVGKLTTKFMLTYMLNNLSFWRKKSL